jgi:hypothetical protein
MAQDENKISDQIDGGLSLREEMENLADHICSTELNQKPSNENLAFRKTLVHGMRSWYLYSANQDSLLNAARPA